MLTKFTFNNQYIFNELSSKEKRLFEDVMHLKKYLKNQPVFTQDSIPSGIFFVRSGKVKKYKVDVEGREQIIYIYNPGEFFGYSAVLSDEPYGTCTAVIEDSEISFISRQDFFQLLDSLPNFSRLLLKSLSHEFRVTVNLMAVLSQRTVRERVALCLLILFEKYKSDEGNKITISRADLANMAGTVIETLARILHEFKDEDLVSIQGRGITVKDQKALSKIANFY